MVWPQIRRSAVDRRGQPGHQFRPDEENDDGQQLQDHERHHTPVDHAGADPGRRHAPKIEQGEAEGRGEETRLQHDADGHAKPDRVQPEGQQDRGGDRDDDEDDLEGVEDEPEQEHDEHHDDGGADDAAGHAGQELMHQIVAAHHAEDDREYRGAEQDDEDHRGHGGGGDGGFLQDAEGEAAGNQGQQHGPDRTHGGGFGGRRDAPEDGTEHGDDEGKSRDQGHQHLAPEVALFGLRHRRRRTGVGIGDGLDDHPQQIEADQQQAGNEGAGKQGADGDGLRREVPLRHLHLRIDARQHVAHEDQHGGGGDDLAQRPGGTDDPGGEPR